MCVLCIYRVRELLNSTVRGAVQPKMTAVHGNVHNSVLLGACAECSVVQRMPSNLYTCQKQCISIEMRYMHNHISKGKTATRLSRLAEHFRSISFNEAFHEQPAQC